MVQDMHPSRFWDFVVQARGTHLGLVGCGKHSHSHSHRAQVLIYSVRQVFADQSSQDYEHAEKPNDFPSADIWQKCPSTSLRRTFGRSMLDGVDDSWLAGPSSCTSSRSHGCTAQQGFWVPDAETGDRQRAHRKPRPASSCGWNRGASPGQISWLERDCWPPWDCASRGS